MIRVFFNKIVFKLIKKMYAIILHESRMLIRALSNLHNTYLIFPDMPEESSNSVYFFKRKSHDMEKSTIMLLRKSSVDFINRLLVCGVCVTDVYLAISFKLLRIRFILIVIDTTFKYTV